MNTKKVYRLSALMPVQFVTLSPIDTKNRDVFKHMKQFLYLKVFLIAVLWPLVVFAQPPVIPDIAFVSIHAGNFIMGTADLDEVLFELPPDADASLVRDEQPAHRVSLSAFQIGRYEVTQQQWLQLMGTRPGPAAYWRHPDWQRLPVVSISWLDTQNFITRLNRLQSQYTYRLPTEAEWEYVARAGSTGLRPFPAENLTDHAWVLSNSGDVPHPVGQKPANAFGVYDMFGNAWEWVQDWYQPDAYSHHTPQNPVGPAGGRLRVRRGGSYHCASHIVRSGYRAADKPGQRYSVLGFRVVRIARNQ
jgi:formylglycine-generating enzyme required for sulfatase activity